jgi:chromosome partitioning protein
MQCEYYALEGLSALLATIERVKRALNPRLALDGVLFCMHDPRPNLTTQVTDEVRQHLGEKVLKTVIPRTVRLAEAPSHGKPILLYDKDSRGCASYLALTEELLRRRIVGAPQTRREVA